VQAEGKLSFYLPYPEGKALKVTYRDERESAEIARPPCIGTTIELSAEPGNLCVLRGPGTPTEANDKGVEDKPSEVGTGSLKFRDALGDEFASGTATSAEGNQPLHGMSIAFRSRQWSSTGTATLAEVVSMAAKGSYAVTAP
jgi:hypothetical protein